MFSGLSVYSLLLNFKNKFVLTNDNNNKDILIKFMMMQNDSLKERAINKHKYLERLKY